MHSDGPVQPDHVGVHDQLVDLERGDPSPAFTKRDRVLNGLCVPPTSPLQAQHLKLGIYHELVW